MAAVDLVVFDMDDVLCHYDFGRRLSCISEVTGLSGDFIEQTIYQSGFDDEGDRGLHTSESYLEKFANRLGVAVSREDWLWARAQSIRPNEDMLALVAEVREQVDVAMLTNNGPVLQEGLGDVFPQAVDLFGDRAYFSCQLSSTKEEPEIFHLLLARIGRQPERTLFMDDSETYIACAKAAGLKTHLFKGVDGVRNTLRSLGLTVDETGPSAQ